MVRRDTTKYKKAWRKDGRKEDPVTTEARLTPAQKLPERKVTDMKVRVAVWMPMHTRVVKIIHYDYVFTVTLLAMISLGRLTAHPHLYTTSFLR